MSPTPTCTITAALGELQFSEVGIGILRLEFCNVLAYLFNDTDSCADSQPCSIAKISVSNLRGQEPCPGEGNAGLWHKHRCA